MIGIHCRARALANSLYSLIIIIYISVERTILHRNIYGSLTVPLLHHRGKIQQGVLQALCPWNRQLVSHTTLGRASLPKR